MSSMLYPDYLPQAVEVEGVVYAVRPEFYIVLEALKLITDDNANMAIALDLFYIDGHPRGIRKAAEAFYAFVGGAGWNNGYKAEAPDDPIFDWEKDAPFIWAGLKQSYPAWDWSHAHWYEFRAAIDSLPSTAKINEIVRIRATKIDNKASPEQRREMERLKAQYSLGPVVHEDDKTAQELEAEYIRLAERQV